MKILKMRGSTRVYSRKNELQAPASVPIPPDWLKGEAKTEWDRVTSVLGPLGILTELDRAVLVTYCQTWADYVEALKYCKVILIKTIQGNVIQNPAIGIKNRAHQLLLKAAAELGMSPTARTSMAIPQRGEKKGGFFQKWDLPGPA